eukprot:gene8014-10861_t
MTSKVVDEFSTNVPDKEERKRQRKKRIDKNNAEDSSKYDQEIQEKDHTSIKTGQQQVSDSIFSLDHRKHLGLQDVTSIRVATNDSEAKRRIADEELRKSRLGKLQQEALASAKANAAIEMKWAELLEKEIPQELHQEIQIQMDACNAIIRSKDELISDFQHQLRGKDEEYVRTLRQQADDIDDLLSRIRREFKELQHEYDKELDSIEEAYLEERERIIAEHSAEIENMFELRKNKEIYYKESKQKSEEQYQHEIEELITKGADQYNKLKIELEMNIQALKQQLEEIRATYQLNTEKLDYNFRVLSELDVERNLELGRYKRRLNKLKEQLNVLVVKYNEMEATDSKTNNELTEDYRSLTLKYKDLQAKFRHFEVADTTKYDEVWTMHEEEVKDLVDQLLKADKIIAEQQLGWNWRQPDIHALQKVLGKHGLGLGAGNESSGIGAEENEENKEESDEANKKSEFDPIDAKAKKVQGTKVRAVLKILASEAGFMLNPQVVASVNSLPIDEAEIYRAENMLKALGVKTETQLNTLLNYFFKEKVVVSEDNIELFESNLEAEHENELELLLTNAAEDVAELKELIKPEDVIAAVTAYMEDMSVEGPIGVPAKVGGGKQTQEEIRIAQKRLANMRNYWVNLSQIVSDESVDVWTQLERDSSNLRVLLSKRSETISDVDKLSKQNAELKSLLNQYLGDVITNSAFKIPPAQVMKVRDVTMKSNTMHDSTKKSTLPTGKTSKRLVQTGRALMNKTT